VVEQQQTERSIHMPPSQQAPPTSSAAPHASKQAGRLRPLFAAGLVERCAQVWVVPNLIRLEATEPNLTNRFLQTQHTQAHAMHTGQNN
jgi:hypothetical protein